MTEKRRRHTAEVKAEVLRKVLKEKRPVSEVCEECGLQLAIPNPSVCVFE